MMLVDANLLIYAVNRDVLHHSAARRWLEESLSSHHPVGFASTVILAFLRITTNSKIFENALSPEAAVDFVDTWLGQPPSQIVVPGPGYWAIYRSLLLEVGTAGNLTSDVHLAALALEQGWTVVSADHDFQRFPGLSYSNPVA